MNRFTRREALATPALALFVRRLSALPLSDIKLGITSDEIDDDVQSAAKFLADNGLKWAEVRNIWGKYNTEQPIEKVKEARSIFDEHGVQVSIEGTGFFKVALPPDTPEGQKKLDDQWALLDRCMERAKVFGTDKLRVFTFMLARGESPSEKSYARIDELMREAARRAKPGGFRLSVENIGGGHVATGAQAGEFLKRVKEDNIGITWDPNNAGESGEKSFPDGYRKLDPARIFHVHLRDYVHQPDGKVVWAAVGTGEFDNVSQIRALRKDGYNGTFTLETHWRDPKFKGDPHVARYSTETSLKGMLEVIKKV
ncbi:MAG TPA: sugar phosphate isomerase/epimerase family protein [Candidatus Sulfopaludibacter sp.]|jgi:sugar phosphate isomerase/epimerase|nr:sugar phosphate isomerase/epimerase family protein [Candidatus Sulfopaludibacter sp.]